MSDADLARRALALLDLTELGDRATEADIRALCTKARGDAVVPAVAAVCVWPRHAALARTLLADSTIRIATVVNFPAGSYSLALVLGEARAAIADGVDEIDLVMPWRKFLAGEEDHACGMIRTLRALMPPSLRLKVIFESGSWPDAATIRRAGSLAIETGADFLKTSTGKNGTGATPEAARAMLDAIRASGKPVGFKPSGGIRTLEDARAYLSLADEIMGKGWARAETFRFGASGLHAALAAALTGAKPEAAKGY
ncbi:MAG: deoxyribose-phosphate aldolase [Proteobacteria bacterium]|nr:deoxyribose-phosphate aldolase [Pseudomonadota bacterium]